MDSVPLVRPKLTKRRPVFERVLMRCAFIAGVVDIAFFCLFHIACSPILAWINIVSVILYACAYYAIHNNRQRLGVILICTEVFLHAALGIVLIGWESGFHYFLLMFIPGICISSRRKPALIALCMLFAFYTGLSLLQWIIDPIQPINPFALNVVHVFNLSVVFVMFSYLSFYYLKTVRRAQNELQILATTDPLTALFNRRHMTYLADQEVKRTDRSNNCISVMLIDLDHFKNINDQFGHTVGDKVLIAAAKILNKEVRQQDLVARWGGEEFLIILPDSGGEDAKLSAERIRKAFQDYDWLSILQKHERLTLSAGVCELGKTENLSTAIARADRALYKCKGLGRNRIEFDIAEEE